MEILKYLNKEINRLTKEIKNCENIISNTSKEKIVVRKRNNSFVYTKKIPQDKGYKEIYLPQGSSELLDFCKRDYAKIKIKEDQEKLKICKQLYEILTCESLADKYIRTHEGVANLLLPLLHPVKKSNLEYLNDNYPRNSFNPDGLKYSTVIPSLKVRSKSEADIISRLVHYDIPFRYEEGIQTPSGMLYPDITCIALTTKRKIYWEHSGCMDNIKYATNSINRLSKLYSAGLIMWDNLIVTTETSNYPLDIGWVDEIIRHYLL